VAKITTCDGTGVAIPDDTPTTGAFQHQYCIEARPIAEKYLADVDELHTRCADMFKIGLELLREEARKSLNQLPDLP
jgi:hypothetical protein